MKRVAHNLCVNHAPLPRACDPGYRRRRARVKSIGRMPGFPPNSKMANPADRLGRVFSFADQSMSLRKRGARILQISPAVNGKTVWNLDTDGPLNLGTQGVWYATPLGSFVVFVKAWGEGGEKRYSNNIPGVGAFSGGAIQLVASTTIRLGVGQGRGNGGPYGASGGGWSGVVLDASDVAVLIAGGGGGSSSINYQVSSIGGPAGWPNGSDGAVDPHGNDQGGKGATQTAPGNGGNAGGGISATNGLAGVGRNGGTGGWGGAGGGGGYFGGGGGSGSDYSGAGGGGGSSYFNPALVSGALMLFGSGTTPGNASDPQRDGAGNELSGRLILL